MDIYRTTFRILSSQTDMTRTLRPSSLFTILQEAAIAHTQALGAGREKTLDRGLLWVITMQQVEIQRMPVYDEQVTLLSWPGKTMHLFFPRYWQMTDAEGRPLIEASSLWGLMDQDSRKLVFPEEYNISLPDMSNGRNGSIPLRIRAQQTPTVQEFTVPYSYTDLNGHMNNAHYLDLAQDCMPETIRQRKPARIRAEYIEEIRYGDTLSLYAGQLSDGSWYFAGQREHPVFRILFQFHPADGLTGSPEKRQNL